jgi:hypothetical protein
LSKVYARDYDDLYARDVDIYGRDIDELYERDFEVYARDVDELLERDLKNHILSRRETSLDILDQFYKREANMLNDLMRRTTPPSSPSRSSPGREDTAKEVGMTRQKTTKDKKMRVVGVNGCTAIFLFGGGFITGAHASPTELEGRAKSAGAEALKNGKVTSVTIVSPDKADGDKTAAAIKAAVPNVPVLVHQYAMDQSANAGFYSFTADIGSPHNVQTQFVPGSGSGSRSGSGSPKRR